MYLHVDSSRVIFWSWTNYEVERIPINTSENVESCEVMQYVRKTGTHHKITALSMELGGANTI